MRLFNNEIIQLFGKKGKAVAFYIRSCNDCVFVNGDYCILRQHQFPIECSYHIYMQH